MKPAPLRWAVQLGYEAGWLSEQCSCSSTIPPSRQEISLQPGSAGALSPMPQPFCLQQCHLGSVLPSALGPGGLQCIAVSSALAQCCGCAGERGAPSLVSLAQLAPDIQTKPDFTLSLPPTALPVCQEIRKPLMKTKGEKHSQGKKASASAPPARSSWKRQEDGNTAPQFVNQSQKQPLGRDTTPSPKRVFGNVVLKSGLELFSKVTATVKCYEVTNSRTLQPEKDSFFPVYQVTHVQWGVEYSLLLRAVFTPTRRAGKRKHTNQFLTTYVQGKFLAVAQPWRSPQQKHISLALEDDFFATNNCCSTAC